MTITKKIILIFAIIAMLLCASLSVIGAYTDTNTDWYVSYDVADANTVTSYKESYEFYRDAHYYDSGFMAGVEEGSGRLDDVTIDWVSWLGTAVGGFFDFEIMPGFSLGGILAVVIMLGLVMTFLKFFAGG